MNDTDNVLIQTIDLTEYYGSKGAVEGLDFTVRAGEIFGFLGPNGAGKTTTMKMIVGLLRPTRGEALVGGHNVQEEPIGAKAVSRYLPEEPNLYPKLSGRECLSCVGDLFGMATAQIAQRSEELLRIFDLDEAADNYRFVQPRDAAEDRYCRCADARPPRGGAGRAHLWHRSKERLAEWRLRGNEGDGVRGDSTWRWGVR